MKNLILFGAFVATSAFGHIHGDDSTMGAYKAKKFEYANIYADSLIEKFDQELDSSDLNPMTSKTYLELMAARNYIEKFNQAPLPKSTGQILTIKNSLTYTQVVSEIREHIPNIDLFSKVDSIVRDQALKGAYPSTGRDGNLTGNTFPRGVWSLTFDDGPRGNRTKTVVNNLYRRGIKGTFFMLAREAKKYSSTVRYVVDSGMDVALHSYTHKNLNKASSATMDYEVKTAKRDLQNISGTTITEFRLPYGSGLRNSTLRQKIAAQKLVHIFWNVDTLDWKDKNPDSIVRRTKTQMRKTRRNAGIILFHDIHSQTVTASAKVMDHILNNGLKVCLVKDAIKYLNGKRQNCI